MLWHRHWREIQTHDLSYVYKQTKKLLYPKIQLWLIQSKKYFVIEGHVILVSISRGRSPSRSSDRMVLRTSAPNIQKYSSCEWPLLYWWLTAMKLACSSKVVLDSSLGKRYTLYIKRFQNDEPNPEILFVIKGLRVVQTFLILRFVFSLIVEFPFQK